jgi:putative hydrolase of the HAD superfamily
MILVFDVDDTLYDELTFVLSGFKAVARHLQAQYDLPPARTQRLMRELLDEKGRGAIFDEVLRAHGVYSRGEVKRCVTVFRSHVPQIKLYQDARAFLARQHAAGEHALYAVTDGNARAQSRKVAALGLSRWLQHSFVTHRYGVANAKPSPHCFLKICEREGVSPSQVVYFGDNPRKDFVGIKPLGFRTVRLMRGSHRAVEMPARYEAEFRIQSFRDVDDALLKKLAAPRLAKPKKGTVVAHG